MESGKLIPFPLEKRFPASRLKAYTFRVYLVRGPYGEEAAGRTIYRTLKLRGDQTLEDLHFGILCAFDREEDRPYEFCFGKEPFDGREAKYVCTPCCTPLTEEEDQEGDGCCGVARSVNLESLGLEEGQSFAYWFDLRNEWEHRVQVAAVEPARASEDYPWLVEKVGSAPELLPDREGGDGEDLEEIVEEDMITLLVGELQVRWREQVENVPLRADTRLATALRKLPAHWLEGMCEHHGIEDPGTRKGRVERLAAHLDSIKRLRRIWRSLPLPSREMLGWLVAEKEGWVKIQQLSRRYGTDPDISWWWNEGQVPETPLGLLRLNGLVYVGRTREGKRRVRIASVPVDLREALLTIVLDPKSMEDVSALLKAPGREPLDPAEPCPEHGGRAAYQDPWRGVEALNLKSFLAVCPYRKDTEGLYTQMLGRVRREPTAFPKKDMREFLGRMIQGESDWNRLAAYKLGLAVLDERFVTSALADPSPLIRQWAQNALDNHQERLF